MDLEPSAAGKLHVRWGKAEGWIFGGLTALVMLLLSILIGILSFYGKAWDAKLTKQGDAIQDLTKQQAVTSAQITTLSAQLADVPSLTREMAEVKVQVKRNTDDIDELRKLRGLR